MAPRLFKGIYWPIVVVAGVLTGLGIVSIYSASFRLGGGFASKQAAWACVALAAFFLTVWIGYRFFAGVSFVVYALNVILLILVLVIGDARMGANRWISIGPFALQPSELCKMSLILSLGELLSSRSGGGKQKRAFLCAGVLTAVPFFLILKQPDLGSALVLIPIFLGMTFYWGIRLRYLALLFILAILAAPLAWHALKPYQQKRLLVFVNPSIDPVGASYTAIQSKIAVGSGGLFGKGWLRGTQTQLDFVPEHHTDFIFSVIGEEFGFVGALVTLALFFALIAYAFHILEHTTDTKARLIAAGIASFLAFQLFINIGMTIGLAPITGLTLPFLSYGGSSLLAAFFALGLLVSIYRERSIF